MKIRGFTPSMAIVASMVLLAGLITPIAPSRLVGATEQEQTETSNSTEMDEHHNTLQLEGPDENVVNEEADNSTQPMNRRQAHNDPASTTPNPTTRNAQPNDRMGTQDRTEQSRTNQPNGEVTEARQLGALEVPLREHASLTLAMVKAELADDPDQKAIMQAVNHNSTQISTAVNSLYPGTRDEFQAMWQRHIQYYRDYTRATERGNKQGQQQARQNLTNFAAQTSKLLDRADNNLNQDHVRQHLAAHGSRVTTMIDAYARRDYSTAYTLAHREYEHMGRMADALTGRR